MLQKGFNDYILTKLRPSRLWNQPLGWKRIGGSPLRKGGTEGHHARETEELSREAGIEKNLKDELKRPHTSNGQGRVSDGGTPPCEKEQSFPLTKKLKEETK